MRAETIICGYCGEPAPNSTRGQDRKYHTDCALKVKADRKRRMREDPEVRKRDREYQRKRRAERRENPKTAAYDRELQRSRAARHRERVKAANEVKNELTLAKIELGKASDTLTDAAHRVNRKFVEIDNRLKEVESKLSIERSDDAQEESPKHRPVFDRLRQ